jgi:PqqD family protein of HPr-rel-A system
LTDGRRLGRRAEVLVEPLGLSWAAYSPFSGETHLLNAEAAAILEILDEEPRSEVALRAALVHETGAAEAEVAQALDASLLQLRAAGLIAPG